MKIRQKGEKYYKKFSPVKVDVIAWVVVALAIIYILIEVIRG